MPETAAPTERGARWPVFTLCAGVALAFAGLGFGGLRLHEVAREELQLETDPEPLSAARERSTATRISARLAEVGLLRGQRALFELCALGDLRSIPGSALSLLIVHREAKRLMLRVPLDAAHLAYVKRSAERSCLVLGSGTIEQTGIYHVEAVWPEVDKPPPAATLALPLWLRIQAKPHLTPLDLACVVGLGVALLLLLVAALGLPPAAQPSPAAESGGLLRSAAPLFALGCLYLAMQWPSLGALQTLGKGVGLLALQTGLALWLMAPRASTLPLERWRLLGMTRVQRPRAASAAALLAVPALVGVAKLSLRWVPRWDPLESTCRHASLSIL